MHPVRMRGLLKSCSWSLVPADVREEYISGKKTDSAPVIDLLSHGYAKLLGKGKDQLVIGGL
jgi:hypothetical protein